MPLRFHIDNMKTYLGFTTLNLIKKIKKKHAKKEESYLENEQRLTFGAHCNTLLHFTVVIHVCRELLDMTCRLGNLLRRRGVKKGDCVTIYMPPCPLAVASMLACARIGAAHNVVFAGFSSDALAERIRDGKFRAVHIWPRDTIYLQLLSSL